MKKKWILILLVTVFFGGNGAICAQDLLAEEENFNDLNSVFENEVKLMLDSDHRFYPSQDFLGTYEEIWRGAQRVLNSYDLEYLNKKKGYIRTRWQDNTKFESFLYDGEKNILASRFRLTLILDDPYLKKNRGEDKMVIKVTVVKEQHHINRKRESFTPIKSDGIQEKILLYRLRKLLEINQRIKKLREEDKVFSKDFDSEKRQQIMSPTVSI